MINSLEMPRLGQPLPCAHIAWRYGLALLLSLLLSCAHAEPLQLLSLDFTTLPGDNLQVQLTLSGPAFMPRIFQTDNPARIALDLPGVSNGLEKKQFPVNVGGAQSIQAIAVADRTRVVINLIEATQYNTRVEGNDIFVVLQKGKARTMTEPLRPTLSALRPLYKPVSDGYPMQQGILNIDFRRGEKGVGRILVTLASPNMIADIREDGRKIVAAFPNASLPTNLARRLDVMDFATPVQTIDAMEDGNGAKLVITPATEEYDFSSYQSDNLLTIEFRPLTRIEKEENKKKNFTYDGQKLSLNFQDIPVRSVFQILADFTKEQFPPNGLNLVASDTVVGNVTLRLNDVPWDQALDLVLKTKNLGKRQEGNIIQIMPLDELNRQKKEELEQQKVVEELEPLRTEIIQINYTNAEDIKKVLLATTEKTSQIAGQAPGIGGGTGLTSTTTLDVSQSLLSSRGNVTVDQRTNQLIVKDTAKNLERIKELIKQLDVAVRQVVIESRVVIASNNFARELGSRFSVNNPSPARQAVITSANGGTSSFTRSIPEPSGFFASGDTLTDLGLTGVAGPGGVLGATVLKVGDYLLDLELSAAQNEGRSEIVSNPRVVTTDQTKAIIKQGSQIPYSSGSTATTVATVTFKDVVLELNVTPHITPDENIRMELLIKKDVPTGVPYNGNPAIDKREINTSVQVANGDTVVLGGIYENTKTTNTDKVPFFGDLPGVGFLFRRNSIVDQKKELLIFITPKILKQNLGQH
jgi:type IV pilus assembly protein PilQ